MDDGEEEMGFDAFPCIIWTGVFFDFFSQVWFLFSFLWISHMYCLCLRMATKNAEKGISLSSLSQFKVWRSTSCWISSACWISQNLRRGMPPSPVKCLLKLLPFMVSIVYWDYSISFPSETVAPTKQRDMKYHMLRFRCSEHYFVFDGSVSDPPWDWFARPAAQLDHHVRIIHPSHVHQIDYCPEIGS